MLCCMLAALVKAGTFKNVVVTAGGCTAKLGMNGKDHVKKGLPILEDAIAGFSVLVSADDGVSPQIRTDIIGRHTIGTGSLRERNRLPGGRSVRARRSPYD